MVSVSHSLFFEMLKCYQFYGRDKQAIPKVEYSHKTTTG